MFASQSVHEPVETTAGVLLLFYWQATGLSTKKTDVRGLYWTQAQMV